MAGFLFGNVRILAITIFYYMTDLVTRLNDSKYFTAERVGGRIKIRLAVTIPKEIYCRFDYKSRVKKVVALYSKSAGSLKLGILIPDNPDSETIIFNYLETLTYLLAERQITYDMIKI